MRSAAAFTPIRQLVEGCWPGEWGVDPIADQANCVVYRATDIDDEGHLNGNGGAARFVFPAKVTSKALRENDILLEASGGAPDRPVGRVALVQGLPPCPPALTSNFFRFIRPKQSVDARYLVFQLVALNRSSAIWRYQQQTTGLINLKVADYLGHPIWAPTIAVQQQIATILTSIDTAIEKTEALIEKYQQIKAGLMHDLFTRGVLPNGQLRPAREKAPELYQETAIGWIPKEWGRGRLADYLDPVNGIKPGPFGSSLTKDQYTSSGFRIYGQEQVIAGSLAIGDYYISPAKFAEMRAFEVVENDVLLSLVGTVGCVLVASAPFEPGIINPRLIRLRPAPRKVTADFLKYLLLTNEVCRQIDNLSGGGTMPVINGKVIRRIGVPIVSLAEQLLIVGRLSALERQLTSAIRQHSKLKSQKLGLMQDLLTGKVPVKVGASETANG